MDTLEESHLVIIPSEFFDLLWLPFWLLFPYGDIFDQELDYASTNAQLGESESLIDFDPLNQNTICP